MQPYSEEVYKEEDPRCAKVTKKAKKAQAKATAQAAAKAAAAKAAKDAKDALFGIGQASHSSNPTQTAAKPSLQEEATLRAEAEYAAIVASTIARIEAGEDPIDVVNSMKKTKETGVLPASSGSNAKAEEQDNGDNVD